MSLPKLVTICQALDAKQCSGFKKFVLMYVGKENDQYVALDLLLKNISKIQTTDDVDALAAKHFKNINKKTFMNYLSQLYKYAESWMAFEQMQENEYQQDLLVQQWLNKRGLYNLSDLVVNRVRKSIEEESKLDLNHARVKADLLFEHFFSNNPVKYDFNVPLFNEMVTSANIYTKGINYLFLTELHSYNSIGNVDITDVKRLLLQCLNNDLSSTEIEVSESLLKIYTNYDVPAYLFLSEKLLNHCFNETSKFHFFIASGVITKCLTFKTIGKYSDDHLTNQLTEHGLKTGLYFTNGKLPTASFHNLVVKSALYQPFDIVKEFIETWINKVQTADPIATKNLALAQLSFYNYQFDDIEKLIRRHDFDNFNQKNIAQSIFLITTFMFRKEDPDKYDVAFKATLKFVKYNKSKMSQNLYDGYQNLFAVMKLLEKNKLTSINELDKYAPLMYKKWFHYVLTKKERR